MTDTPTLEITIPIPVQTLRDLLVTAVEGGSNYWAVFTPIERSSDLDYLRVRITELEASRANQPRISREITPADLADGIRRLAEAAAADDGKLPTAAKHLADAISDHDATTADVVLQMAIFGELVYG